MKLMLVLGTIYCVPALVIAKSPSKTTVVGTRLSCAAVDRESQKQINLSCIFENRTREDLLVSLSDVSLAGPVGTPDYIAGLLGGANLGSKENTLQYGIGSDKNFVGGTMMDYWPELTDDDLAKLRRVGANSSIQFEIQVVISDIERFLDRANLRVRLKLIYASESGLKSVQRRTDLPIGCYELLETALLRVAMEPRRIKTRCLVNEIDREQLDLCHSYITHPFKHLFSEIIELPRPVRRDKRPNDKEFYVTDCPSPPVNIGCSNVVPPIITAINLGKHMITVPCPDDTIADACLSPATKFLSVVWSATTGTNDPQCQPSFKAGLTDTAQSRYFDPYRCAGSSCITGARFDLREGGKVASGLYELRLIVENNIGTVQTKRTYAIIPPRSRTKSTS